VLDKDEDRKGFVDTRDGDRTGGGRGEGHDRLTRLILLCEVL
jgi:hypothetical protein